MDFTHTVMRVSEDSYARTRETWTFRLIDTGGIDGLKLKLDEYVKAEAVKPKRALRLVEMYQRLYKNTHEWLPKEVASDVVAEARAEFVRLAVRIPIVAGDKRIG